MSPGVTASSDTGNVTCTVCDWPGSSVILDQPTSRLGGTRTSLTGWLTYTGTTSAPARAPVFVTSNVAVTSSFVDPTDRLLVENVVYESPKANGYSGLYPEPWPEFVPASWSKNFGSSPGFDGQPVQKSPPF